MITFHIHGDSASILAEVLVLVIPYLVNMVNIQWWYMAQNILA